MSAERVVAEAMSWVGTPYRHQGRRKGVGCDCLGLVLGVWQAVKCEEPPEPEPYAMDWAETGGAERMLDAARLHLREVPPAERAAGHVVLFRWRRHLPAQHAGILLSDERFIHAYQGHAVTVSPLEPHWSRRIAGVFAFPSD